MRIYIARFLLLVFSWAIIPGGLAHELFADHTDTECHPHEHLGEPKFETKHRHCEIFEAEGPLYEKPEQAALAQVSCTPAELIAALSLEGFAFSTASCCDRGPPAPVNS